MNLMIQIGLLPLIGLVPRGLLRDVGGKRLRSIRDEIDREFDYPEVGFEFESDLRERCELM